MADKFQSFVQEHTTLECLQTVVPELKELCLNWDNLSDYNRGKQAGYIIGKYGVDILIPGAVISGINKLRHLRRVNTLFTLECCANSAVKRGKIIESSNKYATKAQIIRESAKQGKIIARNSNTKHHIMQKKHAWDKVVNLTGNVEEDFKTVLILLEEQGVTSHQYSTKTINVADGVLRREHEKIILNQNVKIIFNEYVHTGEVFLNDAWVVTE